MRTISVIFARPQFPYCFTTISRLFYYDLRFPPFIIERFQFFISPIFSSSAIIMARVVVRATIRHDTMMMLFSSFGSPSNIISTAIIISIAAVVAWTKPVPVPEVHAFITPNYPLTSPNNSLHRLCHRSLSSTSSSLARHHHVLFDTPILPRPYPTTGTYSSTTCTIRQLFASGKNNNNKNNDDEPAVEITFPTPAAAVELGIRDWPQQFHSSSWTESIIEGGIATRYIFDGNGRLSITYYENNDPGGSAKTMNNVRVYPGTLVEVNGEATLRWTVDDAKKGMIILTPTDEEGGKLALVGGGLLLFCAGLIVGSITGCL